MDAFAATRFAIGAGALVVAATSDIRTRRVRDPLWIVLGSAGLVLLATELAAEAGSWGTWSLVGSAGILFYAIFFGRPLFDTDGFHARPIRIGLLLVAALLFFSPFGDPGSFGDATFVQLASMPCMVIVYQGFYRLRLLHGGADAKGLIALSLLLPAYPDASPFPLLTVDPRVESVLRVAFPFSLVVWIDAAVVSLAVPIGLLVYNAIRGDLALPQALLGYRAQLDPLPRHVWLMERITNRGEHVLVLFPKRGANPISEVAKLRAAGVRRAWVTPQTPFMVPLLVGFVVAFSAGNLLIGILRLGRGAP